MIFSLVKDKDSIFTARDSEVDFQSQYFINVCIMKVR